MKLVGAALAFVLLAGPGMAAGERPPNLVIRDPEAMRPPSAKRSQSPTGLWTPTEEQAKAAYAALALALHDPNLPTTVFAEREEQARVAEKLDTYEVTVWGRTASASATPSLDGRPGERVISIMGICPEEKALWGHGSIVADGGNCFFSAIYDPQANKVLFFAFNGI